MMFKLRSLILLPMFFLLCPRCPSGQAAELPLFCQQADVLKYASKKVAAAECSEGAKKSLIQSFIALFKSKKEFTDEDASLKVKKVMLKNLYKNAVVTSKIWDQLTAEEKKLCPSSFKVILKRTTRADKIKGVRQFHPISKEDVLEICQWSSPALFKHPLSLKMLDRFVGKKQVKLPASYLFHICDDLNSHKIRIRIPFNRTKEKIINIIGIPRHTAADLPLLEHKFKEIWENKEVIKDKELLKLINFIEKEKEFIFSYLNNSFVGNIRLGPPQYKIPLYLQFFDDGQIYIQSDQVLARGGFKTFYRDIAYHTQNPYLVARLTTNNSSKNPTKMETAKQEINILQELQMIPGVPRLYHVGEFINSSDKESGPYLSMHVELFDQGDLYNFLKKNPDLSQEVRLQMALQIVLSLEQIHRSGYVHRDMKLENILVKKTGDVIEVAISDFGLARKHRLRPTHSLDGTHGFIPPEAYYNKVLFNSRLSPYYDVSFMDQKALEQGDIFATGILLYQMFYDKDPEIYLENKKLVDKYHHNTFTASDYDLMVRNVRPPQLGQPPLLQMLNSMLSPLPAERPNLQKVIQTINKQLSHH